MPQRSNKEAGKPPERDWEIPFLDNASRYFFHRMYEKLQTYRPNDRIDGVRRNVLHFNRNPFINLAHYRGGMMGYRYWTFGRRRAAGWHTIETKRPASWDSGCDPEGDLAERRLPIPAALSLWGVFSIFGWLIVAQSAFYLGYAAPYLLTVNSDVTAIETAIGETPAFSLRP